MMEVGSFTSEPQYQRPDQRNSDIDFIKRPEPIMPPQPMAVPAVVPVPVPTSQFGYDGTFGKRLLGRFGTDVLTWNQLDYYANAIPLGSFSYALAFIIYGGRHFPTALYLSYGFYCLSHYAFYIIPEWFVLNQNQSMLYNFGENSICCFYSAWVVLSFGILMASVRTNLLFILQCLTAFGFFLLRAIGEGCGSLATKRNAAGILQAISGFFSLLICMSQLINNEGLHRPCFPTCPMSPYNEVDIAAPNMIPPGAVPPM